MSEGEVIDQMIGFIDLLLAATGVFFTVISVYLAALHYSLSNETWLTRALMFLFVTLAFLMMAAVLIGARRQHEGLTSRLVELDAQGALTAAGRAALANAHSGMNLAVGALTLDQLIVAIVWGSLGLVYLILAYLTLFYRWRAVTPTAAS